MSGLANILASRRSDVLIKMAVQQQPRQDDTETMTDLGDNTSSSSFEMETATLAVQNSSGNGWLHHGHSHTFRPIQFLLPGNVCNGCNQKLDAIMFGARNDEFKQIVRCLGCGVVAHRRCATSKCLQWKGSRTCAVIAKEDCNNSSPLTLKKEVEEEDNSTNDIDFDAVLKILKTEEVTRGKGQEAALSSNKCLIVDKEGELLADVADEDTPLTTPPLENEKRSLETLSSSTLSENIVKFSRESLEVARTVVENTKENLPAKIGAATVAARTSVENAMENGPAKVCAAGIAGGVAGLCLAGPVAGLAGGALGLSAVLEGTAGVSVFVAAVATGSIAGKAQQGRSITDRNRRRRFLLMGERGTAPKVLLVRPDIRVDPVWNQICVAARSTLPKRTITLEQFIHLAKNNSQLFSHRQRYRVFKDINLAGEDEITTRDKVFLTVNRIINDKNSLPGHFYRHLIQEFKNRCEVRRNMLEKNSSISNLSPRARRDDAHAVIKHVTATLLEVRPIFCSSPEMTELAAAAVERLVFGKLYELVFDEIARATQRHDDKLWKKVSELKHHRKLILKERDQVSQPALDALQMLPRERSVEEKLHLCVIFLEEIAHHCSQSIVADDNNERLCTDNLLTMVCKHILACSVESINAEVTFLEEFARDEQLLKGREGYVLVTLQAALHFLDASADLEKDVFTHADNEVSIPVDSIPAAT